jgi:outer membrane protein
MIEFKASWALRVGVIIFLGVSLLASSAAWAQTKIGFVRTERVLKESAPAQAAQKKLEAEFSKREK